MNIQTKNKLSVSINPTYNCNLQCKFCYLNNLDKNKLLKLEDLQNTLQKLSSIYNIFEIDIYGGEITLLDYNYLIKLFNICLLYVKTINIITNGTVLLQSKLLSLPFLKFSISWDFVFRENKKYEERVFNTLKILDTPIILTSPELYNKKEEVVKKLNQLTNKHKIDVKICMPTKNNNIKINLKKYEEFLLYLYFNLNKNFSIIQFEYIENQIMPYAYDSLHCFINPNNEIQILTFDNYEEFKTINDITNINNENISICNNCEYKFKCLAEHYFQLNDKFDCIGLKKLIKRYNEIKKYKNLSYKNRRKLFYLLNNKFDDKNLNYKIIENCNNEQLYNIIQHFFINESELIYPAKSYYVAIIYAWLLNYYFGEDIIKSLDSDDLLNNDDKFFIPYSKNKELYDRLIANIIPNLDNNLYDNSIKKTVYYFKQEFLIHD